MMKNDDYIQHYASKYYDPDYFHQYYLDHRDEMLARKRKGTKLSDAELEAGLNRRATRAAIGAGVTKAQKADTTKLRDKHKAKADAYRADIKARLTVISDKLKSELKAFNDSYKAKAQADTQKTTAKKEQIKKKAENTNTRETREATRELESLRKQMKATKSPSQKVTLQRQINRVNAKLAESKKATAMAKAISTASASNALAGQKANYKKITSANSEKQREAAKTAKEEIREEKKKTLESWRENLNTQLETVRNKYKTIRKTELQNFDASYDTSSSTPDMSAAIAAASARARKMSEERRKRNGRYNH